MQSNIINIVARIFGMQADNADAQMFRAFGTSLSRLHQRLSTLFWSLLRKLYACGNPAGTRAIPEGSSWHKTPTGILRLFVEATSQVPSLGTDTARKFGLRGCN